MNTDNKYQELRQKAESLLKEKGVEKSQKYYEDIDKLVEELNIYQIELEMQNLELQETNQKLVSQQNRYKELYLNAPIAYFTLNQTGNIIELNHAAADVLETPIHTFKYTSIFPYLDENSKNNFIKYFKQVFNSAKIEYGEIVFKNKHKDLIYTNLSAVSYFDSDLGEKLIRCSVIDKTLIKKYEHEINEQKQYNNLLTRYQTIISTTNAGIGITQNNGILTDCNSAFAKLLGYETDELIGKDIRLFNHPEDRDKEFVIFQQLTPENSQVRFEKRYITKNNQIVWGDLTAQIIFNQQKEKEYIVGIVVDITQRKAIEAETQVLNIKLNNTIEELNASNEELRDTNLLIENERKQFLSILDSIPENIYVDDIDTHKILFANNQLKKTIGHDITSEICYHALQNKIVACDFCTIKNIHNINEPYYWEYYNQLLDKYFYVLDQKIKWTDQKTVHFQLAIDITERKKAEEKINQINHRLEASMRGGDMAWWEMELPSGAINFNPNKALMLGRNPEDFTHYSHFINLLHPDDHEPAMQAMHKLISGELDVYKTQYRIKNIDNQYIWFDDSGIITSKENGKVVMTGIVRNINQQKIAEEKIKTIIDKTPIAIVVSSGVEQIHEYMNPEFTRLLGYTIEDVPTIAEWWDKAYPDKDYQQKINNEWTEIVKRAIETHSDTEPIETIARAKNDTLKHIKWGYISTEIQNWAFGYDLTDLRKAEQALKESEERFKKLSSFTFEGIIIHNNGIAIDVNQSIIRLLGYQRDEIVGMNLFEIIHPDYHAIVKENMAKQLAIPYQIIAIRKDGSIFDAEIEAENIQYNNEFFRVACIRDITERKKAELIIEKQNIQLKEAIATKDKFFNIIAHDLKNPFNSILGFSDLLINNIEQYDKDKIKRFVTTINESSKNTFKLLENLLEWARSQQDKIPFNPSEYNLYNLAYETYMLISGNAKDKQITLDLNVNKEIRIVANGEMLKTVIRNLLSNAIKYTSENGKISISGKQINNEVIIEITDTGTGMNEQIKNSLFKIGETKSLVGTNGERGTGFGLLLCKEFVEKHGGAIKVESELGRGSKFIVKLPKTTK